MGANVRRVELNEIIQDALRDPTGSGMEVRLLFRSWIIYKNGSFESEALQSNKRVKLATTALWLAYMEANFMCNIGKYFLTEDEALMLGCLKMQVILSLLCVKHTVRKFFHSFYRRNLEIISHPSIT